MGRVENLDRFRIIPTPFQDFPMRETHHRQPDAALFADNGFLAANHPPPEISPYHQHQANLGLMNANHTYPEPFSLESELNRLSLSARRPYATVSAVGGGGGGGAVSVPNLRNLQDVQRRRVQSAARGQIMQPQQNYCDSDYHDAFYVNGGNNLNEFLLSEYEYELRNSPYSSGRSLNGAAIGYHPRAQRIRSLYGLGNGNHHLNLNRSNENGNGNRNGNGNGNVLQTRAASMNDQFESHGSSASLSTNGSLHRSSRHRPNFSSLEELRGRIYLAAKDQVGCRFLQHKFEEGNAEEVGVIFAELKDHICELMVDQFGNYLVQKFFEVCTEEQLTQLLLMVINDERNFMDICTDMHGTRAVQKLLEHLTTAEQKSLVISVLRRITVALTTSMNGHHVIQHCLKFFSSEDNRHILNVVADNCLDIATDKSGCCVLQQCVGHAEGEPRERLIVEIISNALILSEHPFGNYVVQYILGLKEPQVTADVLAQLRGSYVSLSMNKYGSNVVEKCLRESEGDQMLQIIDEIIRSPNFVSVLQDPFGNYVAQSALAIAKGTMRTCLITKILMNYPDLHSHPHGKRVLACTKGSRHQHV